MQRGTRTSGGRPGTGKARRGGPRPAAGAIRAAAVALCLAAPALEAGAAGLDLGDPTPRWIEVAFERSPESEPGRLRGRFTRRFPAWLEPGPEPGQIRVTIDRRIVEEHLLDDYTPVAGSFSDFVWVFDAATGHVRSARLAGEVVTPMDLGIVRTRTVTRVAVHMTSLERAGFRASSQILGNRMFPYCRDADSLRCHLVPGYALDPETGYVNAVGSIAARTGPVEIRSFSPMGEALFLEGPPAPDVAAGPPLPASSDGAMGPVEGP